MQEEGKYSGIPHHIRADVTGATPCCDGGVACPNSGTGSFSHRVQTAPWFYPARQFSFQVPNQTYPSWKT